MNYRYLAQSIGGFIQQTAVCYLQRGYWFYVMGEIPKGKDPERIDQKLLEKYEINLSKYQRYRRKKDGWANLQYLRYRNIFLLLSTNGQHLFFSEEQSRIQDARRCPLHVFGYALTYRNGRALVSLDKESYRNLEAYFSERALHRGASDIADEIKRLPYESYAPVRRQLLSIVAAANKRRQTAGLPLVPYQCIRYKRTIYQPFAPEFSPALAREEEIIEPRMVGKAEPLSEQLYSKSPISSGLLTGQEVH